MIVVYKWGRPTYAFTDSSSINKGRSGDEELESLCYECLDKLKDSQILFVGLPKQGSSYNSHINSRLTYMYYDAPACLDLYNHKDSIKAVIVFLGPDDYEFNQKFIDFLNHLPSTTPVVAITTDHRFIESKHYSFTRVYANMIENKLIKSSNTKIFASNITKTLFDNYISRFKKSIFLKSSGPSDTSINFSGNNRSTIYIFANQVAKDIHKSRIHRICDYVASRADRHFCLMGDWPSLTEVSESDTVYKIESSIHGEFLHLPHNLSLVKCQFSYPIYLSLLRCLKGSPTVIFYNSEDEQSTDSDLDYLNNFIPAKLFECQWAGLHVLDIVDSSISSSMIDLFTLNTNPVEAVGVLCGLR